MKSLSFATLTLLACTTQLFCADSSDRWPALDDDDTKGTWLIDPTQELTWLKGTPGIENTVAYHLGMNSDWVLHTYKEISSPGTSGPASSNFGIAIVHEPIDTSAPDWRTKSLPSLQIVGSQEFKETTKQSFFEIKQDQHLNVNNRLSTYVAAFAFANPAVTYRYLFLCSDRDEETKVQGLLSEQAKTVNSVFAALQLIYPNVCSTSTYILFDAAGYCNREK